MLLDRIAEAIYTADVQPFPWDKALDEDKGYYLRLASAVLDMVTEHLTEVDHNYDGVLLPAANFLSVEADIARQRRLNA
jgi:hypothetical protein